MASGVNKPIIVSMAVLAAGAVFFLGGGQDLLKPKVQVLKVYNWSDYIAEDTIANFEAETGISVTYDVYDSNEVLEAKMMAQIWANTLKTSCSLSRYSIAML